MLKSKFFTMVLFHSSRQSNTQNIMNVPVGGWACILSSRIAGSAQQVDVVRWNKEIRLWIITEILVMIDISQWNIDNTLHKNLRTKENWDLDIKACVPDGRIMGGKLISLEAEIAHPQLGPENDEFNDGENHEQRWASSQRTRTCLLFDHRQF